MPDDPHISYATFLFLRAEVDRLGRELRIAQSDADHWYLRATYTPEDLAEMRRRASLGLDENGAWLWPDSLTTTN